MPRDAGSLEQAVRGHGRCCQVSFCHRNLNLETLENVDRRTKKKTNVEIPIEKPMHTLKRASRVFLRISFLPFFPPSSLSLTTDSLFRTRDRDKREREPAHTSFNVNVAEHEISRRYHAAVKHIISTRAPFRERKKKDK